jgi:heavy metal sensor kinase
VTLSIRTRLTVWYTAVLSAVLAASAFLLSVSYARSRLARLDEELARAGAVLAPLVRPELDEGLALRDAAGEALEDIQMPGRTLAVFDERGALLAGDWRDLPRPERGAVERVSRSVATGAGPYRVHVARYGHGATVYQVAVAEPLAAVDGDLASLRRALLGSAFAALLLAAVGGWWIAHAALRPVALMADEARRISDRTPGARLTAAARDELGALAAAFNDLLVRLETALAQQRQFMADTSHELRTPVSIARTAIEVTLGRAGRAEEEYRDSLGVMAEQMRRLSRLVDDMFTLARTDVALPLERGRLYLDELVADCVKEAGVLAAGRGVRVDWEGPGDVETSGDERRLRQLLSNLLDNAVRHTPSGGAVRVALAVRQAGLEVSVRDGGAGVPAADRERIFERFVRLDASRPAAEGAGLGLPIARAIAEAHGGTLVLAGGDSSGSTFLLRLPPPPVAAAGVMAAGSRAEPAGPQAPPRRRAARDRR